jgi:hypothetical protein
VSLHLLWVDLIADRRIFSLGEFVNSFLIISLLSSSIGIFMPGAQSEFEKNLIDLGIKIPIELESRLIIKKEFTNSPKLKILLSAIKSTHKRCKDTYPGWITSLL